MYQNLTFFKIICKFLPPLPRPYSQWGGVSHTPPHIHPLWFLRRLRPHSPPSLPIYTSGYAIELVAVSDGVITTA